MSFRQVIFQDFWVKLFSLSLAVLIWFTVHLSRRHESGTDAASNQPVDVRNFEHLPVTVMTGANDMRVLKVQPADVAVTVSGDPALLQILRPQDIEVAVTVTNKTLNRGLRVRPKVYTPDGVSVRRVRPADVLVELAPDNPP